METWTHVGCGNCKPTETGMYLLRRYNQHIRMAYDWPSNVSWSCASCLGYHRPRQHVQAHETCRSRSDTAWCRPRRLASSRMERWFVCVPISPDAGSVYSKHKPFKNKSKLKSSRFWQVGWKSWMTTRDAVNVMLLFYFVKHQNRKTRLTNDQWLIRSFRHFCFLLHCCQLYIKVWNGRPLLSGWAHTSV
jgi:hypothetical protein